MEVIGKFPAAFDRPAEIVIRQTPWNRGEEFTVFIEEHGKLWRVVERQPDGKEIRSLQLWPTRDQAFAQAIDRLAHGQKAYKIYE